MLELFVVITQYLNLYVEQLMRETIILLCFTLNVPRETLVSQRYMFIRVWY